MHSIHNEGKSVISKRFIKTLTAKFCKKMTVNDSKSYIFYLNKLVDEFNKTYHHSANKS